MNQIKELFEYLFNAIKIWVIIQPWQQGLRVRLGKTTKQLSPGIYFKIPYFDSVYVQEDRLRMVVLPIQTLSSKDNHTLTLNSSIGYSITSIQQLYQTLYHPETTIGYMAMSIISEFIFTNNLAGITPQKIEEVVLAKLKGEDYGIRFGSFKLTTFAIVRTYRLIQDGQWMDKDIDMNEKK